MRAFSIVALAALALIVVAQASAVAWFKSPDRSLVCGKFKTYRGWIACSRAGERKAWLVNPTGPTLVFRAKYGSVLYGARTLRYGDSIYAANGQISCDMLRSGVRCENVDGHGFALNRWTSTRW